MTVKELIIELQKLPQDFEVVMDTRDVNLSYVSKVYEGSAWNVIVSSEENDEQQK